jgi:hypothetical protein
MLNKVNFETPCAYNNLATVLLCRPQQPLTSRLSVRIFIQTLAVKGINKTAVIGSPPSLLSSFAPVLNLVPS